MCDVILKISLVIFSTLFFRITSTNTSDITDSEISCGCNANRANSSDDRKSYQSLSNIGVEYEYREINDHIPMIHIPGGKFKMGLKEAVIKSDGESPLRYVTLSPFIIDQYEVSNDQFKKFIDSTNYITESEKFGWSFVLFHAIPIHIRTTITQAAKGAEWWIPVNGSYWREPEGPGTDIIITNRLHYPVVQISWNDAVAYCKWRHARLPTEAEWEYAAQGTTIGKSSMFPWGHKLVINGTYKANTFQGQFPDKSKPKDGYEFLAPIDSYGPQNEYGLYNMIGNVWEWVSDWYITDHTTYLVNYGTSKNPINNPQGPKSGRNKVKKGGSFVCHRSYCYRYRTAARYYNTPDTGSLNTGFRCVKDIPSDNTDQEL